jgi:hypothetical protein
MAVIILVGWLMRVVVVAVVVVARLRCTDTDARSIFEVAPCDIENGKQPDPKYLNYRGGLVESASPCN